MFFHSSIKYHSIIIIQVLKATHSKTNDSGDGKSLQIVEGQVGDETGVVNIRIVGGIEYFDFGF